MNRYFTFTHELERGDLALEVTVTYSASPVVNATYWQPAEGAEVEIESIALDGAPFFTTDKEETAIYAACERKAERDLAEDADEAAAYRGEHRMERLMEGEY